jgi:uncharacterized membrane protein
MWLILSLHSIVVLSVSCVTTFALKITLFYVEFSIIFNVSFNNDYIYDILYEKFEDNKTGKQKPYFEG